MAIIHRYLNELQLIENNKQFCGHPINPQSNILIIGTFNPSDESCLKQNNATWFYGRNKSNFWRYFPQALIGQSLHPLDNHTGYPETWRQYCVDNRIVIVDLVKAINTDAILEKFGDDEVNDLICEDLSNTNHFDVETAFKGITFNRVIYSLAWTANNVGKLKEIRNIINTNLLNCGCIENRNQIKCCLTPSRNDENTRLSWNDGVNN